MRVEGLWRLGFRVERGLGLGPSTSWFGVIVTWRPAAIEVTPYNPPHTHTHIHTHTGYKAVETTLLPPSAHSPQLYRAYLSSAEVCEILEGARHALAGIDILRKICNHPDLLERAVSANSPDYGTLRVADLMDPFLT